LNAARSIAMAIPTCLLVTSAGTAGGFDIGLVTGVGLNDSRSTGRYGAIDQGPFLAIRGGRRLNRQADAFLSVAHHRIQFSAPSAAIVESEKKGAWEAQLGIEHALLARARWIRLLSALGYLRTSTPTFVSTSSTAKADSTSDYVFIVGLVVGSNRPTDRVRFRYSVVDRISPFDSLRGRATHVVELGVGVSVNLDRGCDPCR